MIKKPKQHLKIVDNFLESPTLWRSFALAQTYQKDESGYPGCKSIPLDEINQGVFHSLASKLITHVNFYNNRFDRLKIQFAYTTNKHGKGNIHQDESFYNVAGVVYLNEKAPLNTGTVFFNYNSQGALIETLRIENVFNRLVIFDPQVWHAPADLFGEDIETGRLTITFFGIAA